MQGLTVKGGRLINNRPDGITGIQEVAMACKARKREEKIQMMSEAFMRGDVMANRIEMAEESMSKKSMVRVVR